MLTRLVDKIRAAEYILMYLGLVKQYPKLADMLKEWESQAWGLEDAVVDGQRQVEKLKKKLAVVDKKTAELQKKLAVDEGKLAVQDKSQSAVLIAAKEIKGECTLKLSIEFSGGGDVTIMGRAEGDIGCNWQTSETITDAILKGIEQARNLGMVPRD